MQVIAVVGFDSFTEKYLATRIGEQADVRFVPAITREETVIRGTEYPFEERLELGARRIRDAEADGIITYWDFPSSLLAPLLAKRFGFPYASLESVMRCEHKYWFRRNQAEVTETPAFCAFDPFDSEPLTQITLDFPFWIKPVVGHSSMLGFEISDEESFSSALAEMREGIEALTAPFEYPLAQCELPRDLRDAGATLCLAEEIISGGDQYTIEGYVSGSKVHVYGVVASVREPNGHTFNRYQYPASLGIGTLKRMHESAERILAHVGYDQCPFNMEFFHEPESGRLHVLEINTRLSQSHSDLFNKVDGQPHQQIAVDLARGVTPRWRRHGGEFSVAAKHFMRRHEDGVVRRVPDSDQIERLHSEMPDIMFELKVDEGDRLSELPEQEEYSYELADLFIGADDESELLQKYERAAEILEFEID